MSGSKKRKVDALQFADTADLCFDTDEFLVPSYESMDIASQLSSSTQPMMSQESPPDYSDYCATHFLQETAINQPPPSLLDRSSGYDIVPTVRQTGTPVRESDMMISKDTADVPWTNSKSDTVEISSALASPKVFGRDEYIRTMDGIDDVDTPPLRLSPKPERSPGVGGSVDTMSNRRSPLLRQAPTRQFTFSEGDSDDSCSDLAESEKASFLRRISADLLAEYDDVDSGCQGDEECTDILGYVRRTPSDVQAMVANYLSSGKLGTIILTKDNFHYFLHVSTLLNLQRLRDHCMEFCQENNHREILDLVVDCNGSCKADLEYEKKNAFARTMSMISDSDETAMPQYLVVFSRDHSAKRKTTVNVLDLSNFTNIFERHMEKPYQFGAGFACTSIDIKDAPYVFVSGGEGKGLSSVWKYDVLMSRWSKCAKMHHGRSYHGMVTVKNKVYVIGGAEVACIEEYDPTTDKWLECCSLAVHVHKAAVAVLDNKVYIFGGRTPAGPVSSQQIFDVNVHSTQKLSDLPMSCYGGSAVPINNHIFFASNQGHMICLDSTTGVSHLCAHQPTKRKYFAMACKNERMYLVGGVPGNAEDEQVQSYPQYRFNPYKNSWVQKERLNKCFPAYAHCTITFPKKCPIIPFDL